MEIQAAWDKVIEFCFVFFQLLVLNPVFSHSK